MIELSTSRKTEVIDITNRVQEEVRASGVKDGYALIYVPHATAAVVINEYEPRIAQDMVDAAEDMFAERRWRHDEIDDNAKSHLRSMLLGPGEVVPIENGNLQLGTWQSIILFELDGPRSTRKIIVKTIEG